MGELQKLIEIEMFAKIFFLAMRIGVGSSNTSLNHSRMLVHEYQEVKLAVLVSLTEPGELRSK